MARPGRGRKSGNLRRESQRVPGEDHHGNTQARNSGSDRQVQQFLVRQQNSEALSNQIPASRKLSHVYSVDAPMLETILTENVLFGLLRRLRGGHSADSQLGG